MTIPQITPLPDPPTTQDIENFDERGDAFLPAIVQAAEEMNQVVLFVNDAAMDVDSMESIRDDAIQARDDTQQIREVALQEIDQAETHALTEIESARVTTLNQVGTVGGDLVDQAQDSANVAEAARDIALSTVGLPPVDESNLRRLFWPVGMRQTFGEEVTDGVWLPEDGKAYQQSEYPELFGVIGHRYVSDIASRELTRKVGLTDVVIKGEMLLGKKDGEFSVFRILDGFELQKLDTPSQPIVNADAAVGFDGQYVFSTMLEGAYTTAVYQYTVQDSKLVLKGRLELHKGADWTKEAKPYLVSVENGLAIIDCVAGSSSGSPSVFAAYATPTGPKKAAGPISYPGITAVSAIAESEVLVAKSITNNRVILLHKATKTENAEYTLTKGQSITLSEPARVLNLAIGSGVLLVLASKTAADNGTGPFSNVDLLMYEWESLTGTFIFKTTMDIYGPSFTTNPKIGSFFPLAVTERFIVAGAQAFDLSPLFDVRELPRWTNDAYKTVSLSFKSADSAFPVLAVNQSLETIFKAADLDPNTEFYIPDQRPFIAPHFPHIKA